MIVIEPRVADDIGKYAEEHYPHECCGVLVGSSGRISRFNPARNTVTDRARDRYDLHPGDLLAAEKQADRDGLEILGFFHSHPDHPAVPSELDLSRAWEGYSYLIAEVRERRCVSVRAWRLRSGSFEEIPLEKG